MKLVKILLGMVVFGAVIIVVILLIVGYFRPSKSGLLIETSVPATVFIDGKMAGKTPFDETWTAGLIVVKLIPDTFEKPYMPYLTRIELLPGVKTIIQHTFGANDDTSSGVIVALEKNTGSETSIAVISTPDGAQVLLDGQIRNTTPFKTSSVTEGDHTLTVTKDGYQEKSIKVKTRRGYKLTADIALSRNSAVNNPDNSNNP